MTVYGKHHVLNTLNSWRPFLLMKGWSKENNDYFSLLHVMFQLVPFPLQNVAVISPSFSFAAAVAAEPILLTFTSLSRLKSRWALASLTPSLHDQTMSLYCSRAACPCLHILHASILCFSLIRSSLLIPVVLLPLWLATHWAGPFLSMEEMILENQPSLQDTSSLSAYWILWLASAIDRQTSWELSCTSYFGLHV